MTRLKEGESRDYIFNLRQGFLKTPSWKRSKKAVAVLRKLIARHSKVGNVRLGQWLNTEIHRHGAKNPPSKVKVNVKIEKLKDEKTKAETLIARAELAELPARALRLAKLEEEKKKTAKEKKAVEKPEKKEEKVEKKEERKPTKKEERKISKKELQKELAEAKGEEDKKKQARLTAAQERALHK